MSWRVLLLPVQARVLLASTRSAGLGLNLTCASRVTILDVWWNGASEDQVRCTRACSGLLYALRAGRMRCSASFTIGC